jgi:type I pantothenate kinase
VTQVEITGDDWRTIGRPLTLAAHEAIEALLVDVPAGATRHDSARRVGADHLPLAELVCLLADNRTRRAAEVGRLLGTAVDPSPFVVGLSGGVAVGKSMAAAALAALLREQCGRSASVVSTDGFLLPNAELEARGIMHRKGFPESYDQAQLVAFLDALGAGHDDVTVPRYDHLASDVLAGPGAPVGQPDVLVVEGVNVLQRGGDVGTLVADHLDWSVYVDAEVDHMHAWFTRRLLHLRHRPPAEVPSFFAPMAGASDEEFVAMTDLVWDAVNRPNLTDHIAPSRAHADLVLVKGVDHDLERVVLRGA